MPRRACLMVVLVLSAFGAFSFATSAYAHRGAPPDPEETKPTLTLEKLTDRTWCLFGTGGNVGFVVTDAGVLVVDDQYENVAQGIVDKIASVTDQPIRYLVNTHYHSDHTGGNPVFIKFAEIIAHDTVRPRLLEFPETIRKTYPAKIAAVEKEIAEIEDPVDPYRASLEKDLGLLKYFVDSANAFRVEKAAPPGLTYEGTVTVWLAGEEIRIFHVAPAHTDGDSMVYFRNENVLHVGDVMFNGMVPFIDALAGGSVEGSIENIDYAISQIPSDAKIIPGHGPVTNVEGLRRYRSFLADVRTKVAQAVKSGMSRADTVRAIKMDEYPEIKPGFRTLGNLIEAAYDEIKADR